MHPVRSFLYITNLCPCIQCSQPLKCAFCVSWEYTTQCWCTRRWQMLLAQTSLVWAKTALGFPTFPFHSLTFHSRSGGSFHFSLWITKRCLSEGNTGRWVAQKSTQELRGSWSLDHCDLSLLMATCLGRFYFAFVSCESLQTSALLVVDHMNQFTQNHREKFCLCLEHQLSTQQSFKASRHWLYGLWQPILTFSAIMAVNPGKFLLTSSLWDLTWKNSPLNYWYNC